MTGNEKLCKIYLKNIFFQNVLVFIIFFIDIITPTITYTQFACDIMCVKYVIQLFLHSVQKKTFFSIKSLVCRPWFLLEKKSGVSHLN